MDLLLTVREFLEAWDEGNRQEVLQSATPDFKAALAELPPGFLAKMTRHVCQKKTRRSDFKPQAQLDEKTAVVRLARGDGETIATFQLIDDKWLVSDVAIDSKGRDAADPLAV